MTRPPRPWLRRRLARALALAAAGGALAAPPPASAHAPPAPTAPSAPAADPAPSAVARQPLMTLRRGDAGGPVRELQRALVAHGRELSVDGAFGSSTEAAVKAVQVEFGQEPSGVADPAFLAAIGLELREPPPPGACGVAGVAGQGARWLRAFPVVGEYRYGNDFGAPRHQGRHEGIDLLAERGTAVVAVADATVLRLARTPRGLGGVWVWLRDDAATEFYYAHLDSVAPALAEGDRVAAGQKIGEVGNTGDARWGSPHLHFEVHPGGGTAVNPYQDLRALDPGSGTTASEGGCAVANPPSAPRSPARAARVRLTVRQLQINQRIAQAAVRRVNRLIATVARTELPRGDGARGRITLSRRQLLINQRISQAALLRAHALAARLEGRPEAERGERHAGRVTLSRRQLLINQRVSQAAIRTANELRPRVAAVSTAAG